jgi:hypothetical protein
LDDAATFARLLDEAFGYDSYGTQDTTRLLLEYSVIADKAHEALHQTPYEDRAIVLKGESTLIGAVGFAPCLAPFGRLRSFGGTPHRTPEVGLFWARIVATTENDNTRSIAVMRRLGMTIERNPSAEPRWFQTVGVLANPAT